MAKLSFKRSENSSVPVCAFKNCFSVNFANEANPKNKTPDRCENSNKFGEIQPQNLASFQVYRFLKNQEARIKIQCSKKLIVAKFLRHLKYSLLKI